MELVTVHKLESRMGGTMAMPPPDHIPFGVLLCAADSANSLDPAQRKHKHWERGFKGTLPVACVLGRHCEPGFRAWTYSDKTSCPLVLREPITLGLFLQVLNGSMDGISL